MAARRPPPIADVTRRSIETVVRNRELIEQRHEQIFKAASRIFISRGYHRATVREIAEEAGLSLGSLYSYIRTKEDILYLVFDKLTTSLRENIRKAVDGIKDPVEQMRAALQADIRTTEQYQDEILLMYQETKSLDRQSLHAVLNREADYVRFFEDILRLGYERGVFKGDPRLSADIITYLCSILALRRWNLRRRFSSEEATEGLIAFILRGLGVMAGKGNESAPVARP
jgi:AcrR family transcriptional regulator